MKILKILFTICLTSSLASAEPLHITIPVYSIVPSQLSLQTVSVETIWPEKSADTLTIGDVINKNSSIHSIRSGGVGQQTSVFTRGTNSNHTLFMINGSPITDHSTTNGLFDAGNDPVNYSTSIDVYKGSQSTLFGPNAVGGAVNINTSAVTTDEVGVGMGSNDQKSLSVQKSFFNTTGIYSIKAHKDQSDGYSVVANGDADGYNFQSINFDSEHMFDTGLLKSTIIYRDAKTELDGSGVDDIDYTADSKFYFYQIAFENDRFNFVADRNVHDKEFVNGRCSSNGLCLLSSSEIDTYDSETNHARISVTERKDNFNITTGTDISSYSAEFQNNGSYNSSVDKSAENYAGFVNFDYFHEKWIINGGVRRDWNSLHDPVTTFRLGSGYQITEELTAIAGVNTGFKAPTLYEMYGADNFGYTGNPNLKEETSVTYEIGLKTDVKTDYDSFNSKSTFFLTEITDQINFSNSTYSNDNQGKTKITGWDFSSSYTEDSTTLDVGLMYVSAQDSSDTQMTRRPWWTANLGVKHNINHSTQIWYNWQYYGDHRDIHPTNYSTVDREYQHHSDIGIKHLFHDDVLLEATINNITDEKFERPYGYSQPGRQISLHLKYFF